MNKKKLLKLLERKEARKAELLELGEQTQDVNELRAYNQELTTLNEEIVTLRAVCEDETPTEQQTQTDERTAAVNGEIPGIVISNASSVTQRSQANGETDIEYRNAFRDYITKGIEIPTELRANETTTTSDASTAIPTILVDRIVEKLESTGMILPLVTKTNLAAGVNIPISSVKPVATWVQEGKTSDRQKKTTGHITFTNHKLRCEVAMTVETGTMALGAFETTFVNNVVEAMIKAQEQAIISGSGTASPKGILTETAIEGQALEFTDLGYNTLIEAEAALPQAYEENAVWCMTKKTFMKFIGMVDNNKQPIARVNYGIEGKPERTLLGRTVICCGDYMSSFSESLDDGIVFAFLFNFKDYIVNTVYDMGIQKKQDWDTEDYLTKAVMSIDGKVVDKNSLVTLAKKA